MLQSHPEQRPDERPSNVGRSGIGGPPGDRRHPGPQGRGGETELEGGRSSRRLRAGPAEICSSRGVERGGGQNFTTTDAPVTMPNALRDAKTGKPFPRRRQLAGSGSRGGPWGRFPASSIMGDGRLGTHRPLLRGRSGTGGTRKRPRAKLMAPRPSVAHKKPLGEANRKGGEGWKEDSPLWRQMDSFLLPLRREGTKGGTKLAPGALFISRGPILGVGQRKVHPPGTGRRGGNREQLGGATRGFWIVPGLANQPEAKGPAGGHFPRAPGP